MKLLLTLCAVAQTFLATRAALNMTAFSQEMFWDEPKEGLYEVDVNLFNATNPSVNGHLMTFADLNNDKYTDIITVDESGSTFTLHLFNNKKSNFDLKKTITPDCG